MEEEVAVTEPTETTEPTSMPEVCVCYLIKEDESGRAQVLLGRKKFGMGEGRLVGPGGKLEPGETPREAMVREVEEEVGLFVDPSDLELVGELDYPFPHHPRFSQKSWVFIARTFSGDVRESNELEPVWVHVDSIPLERMWDDARYWLPETLSLPSSASTDTRTAVRATFTFGEDARTVESSDHPGFAAARLLLDGEV